MNAKNAPKNDTETERLRSLILELIANDHDIELTIPDEEIARIVAKETAPLLARIAALEASAAAAKAAPVKPTAATVTTAARVTIAPKAERLDVLRASAAKIKAKAEDAEARSERRNA